jgi:3D (Asp-Asp-Asp) domain-containing protein/peptidoglycan hydrolase CwlO-like protein
MLSVLAVLAGILLVLGVPAPVPAQGPGVGQLTQREASLTAESRAAVVQLYGIESRLAQARSDLARVESRARALARTQASVRRRLQTARRTMALAQRDLGKQLRYLYEQGLPDPIAVVLGATSLQEAIDGLDAVHRAHRVTQQVLDQARSARHNLLVVRRQLAVQAVRTKEAHARLAETADALARAHVERAAYLAGLQRQQELTAAQISRLEQQAAEARARAQEVTREATTQASSPASAPAPASAPPDAVASSADSSVPPPAPVESAAGGTPTAPTAAPPPPRPGGTMTVHATGYCLKGTTATGLPVGPGIVATDPSVIPLGTRMTIPGYGEGVAADTGSGIQGRRIDVWIKSCAAAAAFGRTVTITFH